MEEIPQDILDKSKVDKAIKKIEAAKEEAIDLVIKTARLEEIERQFEIHEVEDQKRFEIQDKDHNLLFQKVSQIMGDVNEKHKENKEINKVFMEELKETKKDINTLKIDVAEVKNDVSWIRGKLEEENEKDDKDKEDMVTKDEFNPVRNIAFGIVILICMTVGGVLINKAIEIINEYFR